MADYVKLVLIGVFLFFTSPISGHAIAQVARSQGIEPQEGTIKAPRLTGMLRERAFRQYFPCIDDGGDRHSGVAVAASVCRDCHVGAYSLISAAMFVNLDAVDVAFTEAAVGAGISTFCCWRPWPDCRLRKARLGQCHCAACRMYSGRGNADLCCADTA